MFPSHDRILAVRPDDPTSPSQLIPPDKFVNQPVKIYQRNYTPRGEEVEIAEAIVEYSSSYSYEDKVQYELMLQDGSISRKNGGKNIPATPATFLSTNLNGTSETVTVESTIGFPFSGVIHVNDEVITYTAKTLNQFLNCVRGRVGVARNHELGSAVYGSVIARMEYEEDGQKFYSYNYVLGISNKIRVVNPGLLHKTTDEIVTADPNS